jgi:3-methyl-2-oxobutanoate hydroxymethyltransferase
MRNWTPTKIRALKGKRKFATVTCYDATSAALIEAMDRDAFPLVLVGDSLGNVMQGHDTSLPVTIDHVIYHAQCVGRVLKNSLLLADMPFGSYQANDDEGFRNAVRLIKEGGADAVKLEGGERCVPLIRRLVDAGIPVCGHLGLTPQSCLAMGFRVQGRDEAAAERLITEAKMLEAAGCFALVVECITASLGAKVAAALSIPVIGIGAGADTDAQILVWQDLLGLNQNRLAKFVRRFGNLGEAAQNALNDYATSVGNGTYPAPEEAYE